MSDAANTFMHMTDTTLASDTGHVLEGLRHSTDTDKGLCGWMSSLPSCAGTG